TRSRRAPRRGPRCRPPTRKRAGSSTSTAVRKATSAGNETTILEGGGDRRSCRLPVWAEREAGRPPVDQQEERRDPRRRRERHVGGVELAPLRPARQGLRGQALHPGRVSGRR